jgi:phosphohistidine phosphatase
LILYLVQHGKAHPKEVDPERGLTPEGRAETEKVAAGAAKIGLRVSEIIHSGKKRARETAEILANHLAPGTVPIASGGLDPDADLAPAVERLGTKDLLMLVGHLPFLEKLVSYLIVGDSSTRVVEFENSGIVCLEAARERPGKGDWAVKWALTPEIA